MQSLYGAIANTNKKEIMAISVDRVYQKVLAVANKEQRGYITPQEFNLLADQAQMIIFEQYFYDLEQRQRGPGNSFDYADIVSNIEEKISMFDIHDHSIGNGGGTGSITLSDLGGTMYRLGTVKIKYTDPIAVGYSSNPEKYHEAEQVQQKEISLYMDSYFTNRFGGPYYSRSRTTGGFKIQIFPLGISDCMISYIKKPKTPDWAYVVAGGKGGLGAGALYNGPASIDFELHDSEESKLVIKILQLAGVTIKDPSLVQVAGIEEAKITQQEKQ